MSFPCNHCKDLDSSYDLQYTSCKSFYHHVCLFPSTIISKSWTHINGPPPSYALAIFSPPNFTLNVPLAYQTSNASTTVSSPPLSLLLYVLITPLFEPYTCPIAYSQTYGA